MGVKPCEEEQGWVMGTARTPTRAEAQTGRSGTAEWANGSCLSLQSPGHLQGN